MRSSAKQYYASRLDQWSNRMTDDRKQKILWVDCLGGLLVGVIVLCACQPISRLDNLPLGIIVGVGIANLVYGSFSLWLTTRHSRPRSLIKLLAIANMLWLVVCIVIVVTNWQQISIFGILHKLGEGLFVASLGYLEWDWQDALVSADIP